MRVKLLAVIIGCVFLASLFGMIGAEETKKEEAKKVEHQYIGAKKCSMCHKKDGIKESWEATAHATAWDKLTPEQQKDKAILPFYTTGTDAKGDLLTGVQCEACHGPGSDYKKKSIMEDRELAIANGLLMPDEKTCLKCHNEKAPTEALAASAKDFNYEKMKVKGIHALKAEATAEEEKKK
jgi:hypothetical protein